jgi:uncharacterized protein YbjT (DUF2867 family)
VAAAALLSEDLLGQRIALTGPQSLTNAEMVEVIGSVLARPLCYREIPAELVRRQFIELGFPATFAAAYIAMLTNTLDQPAAVTDSIPRILGRPAVTFDQWVREHATLFTNK